MTVLSCIQDAANRMGIARPSAVFSGTDRTSYELQEAINEAAVAIRDDYDWQRLRFPQTMTGDGAYTAFDLPSDYARMLKKAALIPSDTPHQPLVHIADTDEWLRMELEDVQSIVRRWTVYQGQVHISPTLSSGTTVKFFYISDKMWSPEGSPTLSKAAADADTDSFFLGDRILKLSLIYRWKESKGRPYEQEKQDYETALDVLAGTDKGSRMVRIGRPRVPSDVNLAYPWPLGQ